MAKRDIPEINAGSMADIAFLLLIFFLVTTTMDTDTGILRQLPPPVEEETPPPVKERNVYVVLVNSRDQLLVEGEPMDIRQLKDGAKEFLTNPTNNPNLPEIRWRRKADVEERVESFRLLLAADPKNQELKTNLSTWESRLNAINWFGDYRELPPSAVISMQNDNGTSYDMYIQVQNELQAAINELRDKLSREQFGVGYNELDPKDETDKLKILAVRQVYPQRISEAEPKDIGGK
ncbi:MAG: ExbD/TolR family protein [Luteibaculaceae bacterium]